MKKWLLLLCCTLLPFSLLANDEIVRKKIKVGGYLWAPFIELHGRNYQGLTLDLIDAANAAQGDFEFEFVLTTPENRHKDFYNKKFDMMFLEDVNWGWNAYPVDASLPLAKGTELFIALDKFGRSQNFFQDMKTKSISVVKGFHYSFAGYSTNEDYLTKNFKIRLDEQPSQVLQDVLDEKSEIGVINSLSLEYAFAQTPKIKNDILIAKKFDQDFVLHILARKNGVMTIDQVNLMIDRLKKDGTMAKLWEKYKLTPGIK